MPDKTAAALLGDELDAFFAQYTLSNQAPGLVYGIASHEGLVHFGGFGVANERGTPPDADTKFPIASMSKSFLACAAVVARDQGLISLTEPITTYVPEFTALGSGMESAPTLEMFLSMSGGLTEDNSWTQFIDGTVDELIALVSGGLRFSNYPGVSYEYSNVGIALVGLAISRAAGCPVEEFVRQSLFEPLGMESTCYDSKVPAGTERAIGYRMGTNGSWSPLAPRVSGAFACVGGIVSTVRDLAKWVTWLGSAFRPPTGSDPDAVLSRSSRRELQRVHIDEPPTLVLGPDGSFRTVQEGYALGLRTSYDAYHGKIVSHSGGLPGFRLFMTWHPTSGNGIVMLSNSDRGDPIALCRRALGMVLERYDVPSSTVVPWAETMELRDRVDRLVRHWDDELATSALAPNVGFDRPLGERRAELARLVEEVGPLRDPGLQPEIVSIATPADVTWSIPAENGQLICMIRVTPSDPAQVHELVVRAFPASTPRAAIPTDLSPHRSMLGEVTFSSIGNTRLAT